MKRILSLLLALALALSLAACAETPEETIVAQKDSDRLVEAASQGVEEESDNALKAVAAAAPERYTYSYENSDKSVTVNVDAQVVLPEGDSIPMYRVSSGEVDQELVDAIYEYVFQGEETYTWENTGRTKAEYEQLILEEQQKIAKWKDDDSLSEEEREDRIALSQELIDDYTELYETASEESTMQKVLRDSTLEKYESGKTLDCETESGKSLSINSEKVGADVWSSIYYIDYGASSWLYSIGDGTPVDETNADSIVDGQIGITYAEAKAKADDFLNAIGIEAELCAASLPEGYATVNTDLYAENDLAYADTYTAYCFRYLRTVDGIPVAGTTYSAVPENTQIWAYEYIEFIVNENGIVKVEWEFPITVEETVSENVSLLSFDEATDIFEKMMSLTYDAYSEGGGANPDISETYDVEVNRVELCLMRVRDSGSARTGLLVPTWVFYGTQTDTVTHHIESAETEAGEESSFTEPEPWIVLAVNAVDGSVIDLLNGY